MLSPIEKIPAITVFKIGRGLERIIMEIDLKRKEIMLIIIIVLALVFGLGYRLAGSGLTNPYETVITKTDGENADTAADKGANDTGVTGRKGENLQEDRVAQMVYFHIVGAVNKPGLYWLPEGARVADAVRLAIPSSRADLNALNLAELVVDQQKIYVPRQGEVNRFTSAQPPVASPGSGGRPAGPTGKVNINTASAKELDSLPGIGPALAERIIEYRQSNGGFKNISDLKKVSGIGDQKFAKLKDLITI